VVRDPAGARECARENVILRRVASAAIEDTGGLFVTTPLDDLDYADRFLAACPTAEVPVEEISPSEALRREPRLTPALRRAFAVNDGSIDSWKLVWSCAQGAEQLGARILPYHPVTAILRDGDRVTGARLHDLRSGDEFEVRAQCVINAAGAWSGRVAQMAGCEVAVRPGKGVMVAINHRIANCVVNRCHMTGDGDIVVPSHSVSVIGTTDTPVEDPDDIDATAEEVASMMAAGDVLLPGFSRSRALRVWSGARPLLPKTAAVGDDREVSRSHSVIRHAQRDALGGLISIAGGKLTTFRLMAKDTVDAACAELGVERSCTTAETPLPGSTGHNYYRLPDHQADFEKGPADNPMVCECELVSQADVLEAARHHPKGQIDDLRRVLRIGMGPCQGGFCAFRTAALLHGHGEYDRAEANAALRAFVQERWKGQRPVLWGQQLRQARLDAWIFQGVLDIEHLPT